MQLLINNEKLKLEVENAKIIEGKKFLRNFLFFGNLLFVGFSVADFFIYPNLFSVFFILRLLMVPISVIAFHFSKKSNNFKYIQFLQAIIAIYGSSLITLMMFLNEGPVSPYYAGICLTAFYAITASSYSNFNISVLVVSLYSPYIVLSLIQKPNGRDLFLFLLYVIFMIGTAIVAILARQSRDKERIETLKIKLVLEEENKARQEIIDRTAKELINSAKLGSQFSPQVVQNIKLGKINISNSIHRSKICCAFFDIVDSTIKVVSLDKEDYVKVINEFIEISTTTLLKYDMTLDKFQGDGFLAFSNDPMAYDDFVDRAIMALLELKEKFANKREFFEDYWRGPFEICAGVSVGYANIGFYGNSTSFRPYTAIGQCVNMASRLCSFADKNEIIISSEVFRNLIDPSKFEIIDKGTTKLKGFINQEIKIYHVNKMKEKVSHLDMNPVCNKCGEIMVIETDPNGHFTFNCNNCSPH